MKWIAVLVFLAVLVGAQELNGSAQSFSGVTENGSGAVVFAYGSSQVLFDIAKEGYLNATIDVEQLRAEGLPYQSLEDRLLIMNESLIGRDEAKLLQTAMLLNRSFEGKAKAQEYFRMINLARQKGIKPGQDFKLVIREAEAIRLEKNRVFELREMLTLLEEQVAGSGVANDSEVQAALRSAQEAFISERYDEFNSRYNETVLRMEDAEVARARERALVSLAGRSVRGYIARYWPQIIGAFILTALLSFWGYLEGRYVFAVKKLRLIGEGIDAVKESLLAAQQDYYAGKISRATYSGKTAQFHEKERDLLAKRGIWQSRSASFRKTAFIARFKSW